MTVAPPLLLVAASGLAREVLSVVRVSGSHRVVGVLDDDATLYGTELAGVPVLGGIDAVAAYPNAEVLVCAGKGRVRESLVTRLARAGVATERYSRARHPSVDIPPGCTVGRGAILLAQVAVTADVTIGEHVVIMPNATITHDDVLCDYATICAGSSLGGSVVVGERAYVGMNASVREGVHVGPDTTIGMGAAVLTDVPPGQTWVGVPAAERTVYEASIADGEALTRDAYSPPAESRRSR